MAMSTQDTSGRIPLRQTAESLNAVMNELDMYSKAIERELFAEEQPEAEAEPMTLEAKDMNPSIENLVLASYIRCNYVVARLAIIGEKLNGKNR